MITKQLTDSMALTFTEAQLRRMHEMRERYQSGFDLFSERQKAQLGFLRWLYETGRLAS